MNGLRSGVGGDSDSIRKLGMKGFPALRFADIPNSRATLYQFDVDKWAQIILVTHRFRPIAPKSSLISGRWINWVRS